MAKAFEKFGKTLEYYQSDFFLRSAISMFLLQIGEIANGLTETTRIVSPVPWSLIRGLRNRIAHGYDDMNQEIIYDTAVNDIPKLKEFCEKFLKEHDC